MKTETTSGGMGKLVLRLILSILLVFSLLGTVGCAVGISVLHSPSQLIAQMHKQNAGQKSTTVYRSASPPTTTPLPFLRMSTWTRSLWTGWSSAWSRS